MLINRIIDYVLGAILISLAMTCISYHVRMVTATEQRDAANAKVEMLSANINAQNDAISKLAAQAQEDNAKLQRAEKAANQAQFTYERNEAQIMGIQITGGCNNAIQWGIQQAIRMREPDAA